MASITHCCSWSDVCFYGAWPLNCCLQLYFYLVHFVLQMTWHLSHHYKYSEHFVVCPQSKSIRFSSNSLKRSRCTKTRTQHWENLTSVLDSTADSHPNSPQRYKTPNLRSASVTESTINHLMLLLWIHHA